jgi:hypothetical protein
MPVVGLSPQRIYHNDYVPLISRDDLAGFHTNDYIHNGSIGNLIL